MKKITIDLNVILDMFKIVPITETILRKALNSKINDYKDAVIEISSQENEIDYIVTRNLDDFKESSIKSVSPSEFLALYKKCD